MENTRKFMKISDHHSKAAEMGEPLHQKIKFEFNKPQEPYFSVLTVFGPMQFAEIHFTFKSEYMQFSKTF